MAERFDFDAGARSVAELVGDGYWQFDVHASVGGAVCGLNTADISSDAFEIQHGFQITGGRFWIYEAGRRVAGPFAFSGLGQFNIVRWQGHIYYTTGRDPGAHPDVAAGFPGVVRHVSVERTVGTVFLDASLYAPFDSIFDIEMFPMSATNHAALSFEPLALKASVGAYAEAPLSFEAMTLESEGESANGMQLTFPPMLFIASQGEYATASMEMPPATVSGSEFNDEIEFSGGSIEMRPLELFASGIEDFDSNCHVSFEPLAMQASETDYAFSAVSMMGMYTYGGGAHADDAPYFMVILPLFESVGYSDGTEITDIILFSDDNTEGSSSEVTEILRVSDATQESRTHEVVETLILGDEVRHAGSQSVEDAIQFSDASEAWSAQVVVETLNLSDAIEHSSESVALVSDTIRFRDAMNSGGANRVEDAILFSDATEVVSSQVLEDAILFRDAVEVAGAPVGAEITDTLILSDATESTSHSVIEISDTLVLSDAYFHKDPGAVAWVMNTETAAPSWYSNWQFSDMMQVGDRVFAVGPEGLVELGAQTDAGEEIDARLQYGFMDFGAEQKKRVDTFMFGYTADGLMSVTVGTYGQQEYEYLMERRDADSPRNNRIRPGKGLNARYWRIEVANTDGCDFDIDSVTADVVPSSRRL